VSQTNGRKNAMAIARRFILTNASCANNNYSDDYDDNDDNDDDV